MADVKVPPLLHKMSVSSQKAWYKKNNMELPGHLSGGEGKSAAQAKKDVGEINKAKAKEDRLKTIAAVAKKVVKPSSDRVRAMRHNADYWGGGLGGGLDRNRDIMSYVRSGGYIKAGRLGEAATQPSDKEIRMARGIAFGKRYKGGNMTAATNAIEKIRQGLSDHPKVAAALRSANEEKEMSHGKKLAKKVMAKQSTHPISQHMGEESVVEEKDEREYGYEGDMAMSQLKSIIANAQKLHDMLEPDTDLPEWVQSKITLAEDYVVTAANYCAGDLEESVNEEVEQIDELKDSTLKSYVKKANKEMNKAFKYHKMDQGGRDGTDPEYMKKTYPWALAKFDRRDAGVEKAKQKLAKEAAEGKTPETETEVNLAKKHGDPKKITYGDVIKARIQSAKNKALKKGE